MHWLDRARAHAPQALADAAALEIMKRSCGEDPKRVHDMLIDLNGEWGTGECKRLALAVPAQCLMLEHDYRHTWLRRLADPQRVRDADCPADMRSRVLAEQANLFGDNGLWHRAAELFRQTTELAAGRAIYRISFAASLLMQEPRSLDYVEQIESNLIPDRLEPQWVIAGQFLLWLATARAEHAERLCSRFGGVGIDKAAMPDLGHLAEYLCTEESSGSCRVYGLLTRPKLKTSMDALRSALGAPATCGS